MSEDQLSGAWPSEVLPKSWIWLPFEQFWLDFTDSQKKLPQKDYLSEGRFAVVDQGEARIGGFSNDESLLSSAPVPAIVFGDHTRAVKLIDVPFIQGADGVRVLGTPNGIDAAYAFKALSAVKLPDKGYSRHFKFLKATSFPLPPLTEQKRIVAKLDALNAKSARARTELARIETLVSRYKQAVLSKAFCGIEAERISLFDLTEFVTSGSRGWAKFYSDTGPLFMRIGNTVRGTIKPDLDDIQRVNPPDGAEGMRTKVRANDIVVTITADLGRIALIDEQMEEAYVNQHLALVRLLNPYSAAFFAWYLVSDEGQAQLHRNNRGATRAGLGLDDIRQVKMPTPPLEEQHEIVRRIESAFAKVDRLAKEAKRALELVGRLDEAILAKAFRGELVPQDENDEPAGLLLERIRQARAGKPSRPKRRVPATKIKVHDMARTIIEALAEAKDWLAAQELFARCGVRDGSSTEDVEKLYRQLLDLQRQDKVEIDEVSDPLTGAKQGNRVRLRK